MKRFVLMLVTLGVVTPAWSADVTAKTAQTPEAMMKVMEEFAKPSPELKKLEPLAGKWNYTMKYWLDPSQPAMESKGTVERKWILGNRFLEEKYLGTGFDGKEFEGCGIIGFDNAKKQFTTGWICNMCTSISKAYGAADSSGKKFTFDREEYCPIRQKLVKGRDEIRIDGNDKIVMEMYETDEGTPKKVGELVSIRQK